MQAGAERDAQYARALHGSVVDEKKRVERVERDAKKEEDAIKLLAADAKLLADKAKATREKRRAGMRAQREAVAAARAVALLRKKKDEEDEEALNKAFAARDLAPPAVSTLSRSKQQKQQKRARSEHADELRERSPRGGVCVSVRSSGVRQTKRQRKAARADAGAGSHGCCDDSSGEVR